MITPRRTRLLRVPDLQAFRRTIAALASEYDDSLIVVPTRSAGYHLSRLITGQPGPRCVTRDELYDTLHAAAGIEPRRLTLFERDSLMHAAAATIEDPPFRIRPGLVAEMVRFYDQLRRQTQGVGRFLELLEAALGGGSEGSDRGTLRLLKQARFLAAAFTSYERLVGESGGLDEHVLRGRLVTPAAGCPARHIVVTVADWIADPEGLFVADFDLLARLPGLATIDLVSTEHVLGSGFHERLHGWWPGIEERDGQKEPGAAIRPRVLVPAPSDRAGVDDAWFTSRDREEELNAVARRLAARGDEASVAVLERIAVVFKRPLPYLYLAPETLGAEGIPFQTADALPLAAEPASAVVDLVLDAVESDFTRSSLTALLRSPHLQLLEAADRAGIAAFDRALSEKGFLGEIARLKAMEPAIRPEAADAYNAAVRLAGELQPLLTAQPASRQIRHLQGFLSAHFTPLDRSDALTSRERRARAAILDLLDALADAHASHYDPSWSISDLAASVRRWIGDQTFVVESAGHGIHLIDDQDARYADVDAITLVGLVENEWPERPRRNIFYPPSLLKALGWPSERDRRGAAEARFLDLLGSAAKTVALSTFTLDDEALVTRSTLLDEIPRARLSTIEEGAASQPAPPTLQSEIERMWTDLRSGRSPSVDPMFHGSLGHELNRAWSVSAVETYLACPFKFFAQYVLKLDEEPEDAEVMDPRKQGQFVHDVFEQFFRAWKSAGHLNVTPAGLDAARAMFADVVERALARLPEAEAGLERTRLLGSAAAAGLGDAVLRMEAERPVAVIDRLLEHRFEPTLTIETTAGSRSVLLKGKADRLDLLADGTFRLIDYKLGWPPDKSKALQLPIYGLAAQQQLSRSQKRDWVLGEAVYLAFKGPKRVVPLFRSPDERDEVLARAEQRLADALDAIARGEFPPQPEDVFLCESCSFASVCRKDYVGEV